MNAGAFAGAAFGDRIEAFISNGFATAVSQTLNYSTSADAGSGAVISVAEVTGMLRSGINALRQIKAGTGSGSVAPEFIFDAACLTGNPLLGLVCNDVSNPLNVTPPSGWTEMLDTGYNTPTSGVETAKRDSGFTGTTITWGSTVANDYSGFVMELDTTAPPAVAAPKQHAYRQRH